MKVISYQNEFTRRNQSLVVMRTPTHPLSSQLCTGAAVISYCLTMVFQYQKDIRALHPSSNVSLPSDQLGAQVTCECSVTPPKATVLTFLQRFGTRQSEKHCISPLKGIRSGDQPVLNETAVVSN